ncbi:hypothetical protein C0991_010995, partial [Blastosporella zonata]
TLSPAQTLPTRINNPSIDPSLEINTPKQLLPGDYPLRLNCKIAAAKNLPADNINPAFSQPALPYSYDDWKCAVISLYPGTNAATKYSMADLDQIMGKAAHTNIKTIGQFTDYYRKFYQ